MKLGKLDLEIINDGIFYLDGGAMFGVVPKVMWSKLNPADDKNRIELALNLLLIKGKDFKILIDTGIGDKLKERFIEIYSVQRGKGLIQNLNDLGIKPDEIDIVINTHLHFDHCGGNTIYNEDKRAIPTFCRAKYFVQKAEWADAVSPNERTKASYLLENFLPIQNSGQLELIEGSKEILPGIEVINTGGHTRGHQMVKIESEGKTALYWGDLIPTTSHLRIPFVMGYDLYPLETIEQKKVFLKRAIDERWLLIFEHDPKIRMAHLEEENGEFKLQPIV